MSAKLRLSEDTVGDRIRTRRIAANMTQDVLAALLGVSRSAIAQWESNRTGQVRDHMERLAKVLKTSVGYLIGGDEGSISEDEQLLIRLYRTCAIEDRRVLLITARRFRRDSTPTPK
ncbi:helix-turn-helix domain-containing protein [Acidocella sp.]|uniref:helix-turn-helix domain-containing protein n=1 Tax=Acidocella sp. TaxID=50710 RepID=UPI002608ED04|nr:helix-turn-helix domain-containing protein [Acidocella sp.]MDD2794639.1 helix-turn-helix domain-containing protein [Acidocella sp.]